MEQSSPDPSLIGRSFQSAVIVWRRCFRPRRALFNRSLLPLVFSFWAGALLLMAAIVLLFLFYDDDVARAARAFGSSRPDIAAFFEVVTHFGLSSWILVLSGVAGLFLSVTNWRNQERKTRLMRVSWHADASFIFFTVAIAGVLASLIKNTIGRARPRHLDELGHLAFDFAAFEPSFASFPSGHSTTFGALCMGLALLLPRFWPLWFFLAVLGGASRVMVGAHYPADVVAGLAFGAGFTWLSARFLAQRGTMFRFSGKPLPRRLRTPDLSNRR